MLIFDEFITRFHYDVDSGLKLTGLFSALSQMYYTAVTDSTWGMFVIVGVSCTIAFLLGWFVNKSTDPLLRYAARFGKWLRAFKGRADMRKRLRAQEERWVADKMVDMLDEGITSGVIRKTSHRLLLGRLGKALKIEDLVPLMMPQKKQMELKSRLKKKHHNKIVDLVEKRKELAAKKPKTLKERLAVA